MFDSEQESVEDNRGLKINKKFEHSFNQRKAREDLERAKGKYGKNIESMMQDGSDSSLAEDDAAILDDENVTLKFLSTLSKIRTKNPLIYDSSQTFFNERDLEPGLKMLEKGYDLGKREIPMTYKRQVQEMVHKVEKGELLENEEELDEVEETPFEIQQRMKKEFKDAAAFNNEENNDDLFVIKKKTKKQIQDEEQEFKRFLSMQKKADKSSAKELKNAFGDKSNLDEGDQFLRKYILTKGWIGDSEGSDGEENYTHLDEGGRLRQLRDQLAKADEEDEEREDEIDKYEERINFRYERPGGEKIQTYERDVKDTMRKKDDTRADKRKERDLRKKEEKQEFKVELEHLKALKKAEMNAKLEKLIKAGGLGDHKKAEALSKMIGNEFNEQEYDKHMEEVFNKDYYDDEDENEEDLLKYIEEAEAKVDTVLAGTASSNIEDAKLHDDGDVEGTILKPSTNIPILMKKKINKEEAEAINQTMADNLWWYCDSCNRGILPLEARYDCMECDDYTECKQCSELKGHEHQLKKFIVPEGR